MSTTNPHNLTIHDLICYLESIAIREATKGLLLPSASSEYQKDLQLKRTRAAQLILRLAKQAAAAKEPNTLLSLLHDLPE